MGSDLHGNELDHAVQHAADRSSCCRARRRDINDFDPGTKIAISEYNYGGTNDISGGIAEADALGIFGQQGVFAANMWPDGDNANMQFANGAFKMYLNYNGTGGKFGDTSIGASVGSGEIANSSVYASLDSTNPNRMVVMAINRTTCRQDGRDLADVRPRVRSCRGLSTHLGGSPNPVRVADIRPDALNALDYSMPAYSVTTLVFVCRRTAGRFQSRWHRRHGRLHRMARFDGPNRQRRCRWQ